MRSFGKTGQMTGHFPKNHAHNTIEKAEKDAASAKNARQRFGGN